MQVLVVGEAMGVLIAGYETSMSAEILEDARAKDIYEAELSGISSLSLVAGAASPELQVYPHIARFFDDGELQARICLGCGGVVTHYCYDDSCENCHVDMTVEECRQAEEQRRLAGFREIMLTLMNAAGNS